MDTMVGMQLSKARFPTLVTGGYPPQGRTPGVPPGVTPTGSPVWCTLQGVPLEWVRTHPTGGGTP